MKNLYTNAALLAATVLTLGACNHAGKAPQAQVKVAAKAAATPVDCTARQDDMDSINEQVEKVVNTATLQQAAGKQAADTTDLQAQIATVHTKYESCSQAEMDLWAQDELKSLTQIDAGNKAIVGNDGPHSPNPSSSSSASTSSSSSSSPSSSSSTKN